MVTGEHAVRERSNYLLATCVAAASGALTGRPSETERAMARVRQLDSGLRLSNLKHLFPFHRSEDFAKFDEAMRKAGLPE